MPGQLTRRFGGGATFGGAQSGAEAQLLSLQEAWKLGRQVAIRSIRGQLLPSGLLRNDSRALGPEGSDDWEKRALEHMGGAIWSSLEQFGWDHLGSPGISEGLQDSGSWGQLGDPRRLPLRFVVLLPSAFCPPEPPSFFSGRNDRRPRGARANPSASPECTAPAPAAGDTTDLPPCTPHARIRYTRSLSLCHSVCPVRCSAASLPILPVFQLRPAGDIHFGHSAARLPCVAPGSRVPVARSGPLLSSPVFFLFLQGCSIR